MKFSELRLRKATEKDLEFCDVLHENNMKSYVEQVYPWNPTLFLENFLPDEYQIIELHHFPIGFIKVVWQKTEIYLGEIQLKRNYQNQGIGSQIINDLIVKSKKSNRKFWLKIIKGNPTERLYQKLGFKIFEESSTHKK